MERLDGNGTRSLAAAVYDYGRSSQEALAVSAGDRSLTYRELANRGAGVADWLEDRLRGRPGDAAGGESELPRVGILASRSVEACIAVLGATWAGVTYVPIGVRLPEERLLTILSLCNLAAIVADEEGAARLTAAVLQAAPPHVLVLAGTPPQAAIAPGRIDWRNPDDLSSQASHPPAPVASTAIAYVIFTSGTTGTPKGVVIPAGAVRHYVDTITPMLGLRPSDRVLGSSELTFDVSVHDMFVTWEAGASLHVLPATRVMAAVRFARERRLTVWNSVPSLAGMLRQVKALAPGALPALRLTVFGGEALSRNVLQAWQAAAPASVVWNLYGPTEATVFCLAQPIRPAGERDATVPVTPGRDVVAIGAAIPGSEAAVVDPSGQPVADGCPGELAIAGVQLAEGYLQAPAATAARFRMLGGRRWYLTGDLGMRDAGGVFHCFGRLDNQIKLLGHRVELEEVDAHLRMVSGADLVGTVAWPVADGAAQGMVGFVAADGIDESKLVAAMKQRLPAYMVPARIVALERMPLNGSGKVDRQALRQRLEAGAA